MKALDEMPGHARVWLYQASQFLTHEQQDLLHKELADFIVQWTSHGARLDAAFGVYYDRLVVIAADEQAAQASGCGIDKSVHIMQELSASMGVDFFQRTVVLFKAGEEWSEAPIHEFWAKRKAGLINETTQVLDTTVKTLDQLRTALVVPFGESWHAEMWGR